MNGRRSAPDEPRTTTTRLLPKREPARMGRDAATIGRFDRRPSGVLLPGSGFGALPRLSPGLPPDPPAVVRRSPGEWPRSRGSGEEFGGGTGGREAAGPRPTRRRAGAARHAAGSDRSLLGRRRNLGTLQSPRGRGIGPERRDRSAARAAGRSPAASRGAARLEGRGG